MTTPDSPDFRALAQELVDATDLLCGSGYSPGQPVTRLILTVHLEVLEELAAKTRATLEATPPPEAPIDVTLEPSFSQRQQLLQGLSRYCFCHTSAHRYLKVWIRDYTRAALERWGHR